MIAELPPFLGGVGPQAGLLAAAQIPSHCYHTRRHHYGGLSVVAAVASKTMHASGAAHGAAAKNPPSAAAVAAVALVAVDATISCVPRALPLARPRGVRPGSTGGGAVGGGALVDGRSAGHSVAASSTCMIIACISMRSLFPSLSPLPTVVLPMSETLLSAAGLVARRGRPARH